MTVVVLIAVLVAGTAGAALGALLAVRWYRRRHSTALSAATLHLVHLGVLIVAVDGTVVVRNPAGDGMGLVRGDRIAVPELRELAADARRTNSIHQAEVRLLHGWLAHEPAAVWARAVPVGRAGHVALLVEDVTEQRRVADIRRDFVANVSHELKTPFGAIALLAEALNEARDEPATVAHFAARLRYETDRLARLAQGLIDLSRLEAADPLPEPTLIPVAQLVAEAIDRTRTTADARDITVGVDDAEECTVSGSHEQLVTALANLLDNAIRYSPPGTRVDVAVRARTADPPVAQIIITDQGEGIAETDLDRVFERFYRADPARSRATGGTGLGLSIVKHIAANHGGRVEVTSRVGHGSRFTLTLPASAPDGAADTARPRHPVGSAR